MTGRAAVSILLTLILEFMLMLMLMLIPVAAEPVVGVWRSVRRILDGAEMFLPLQGKETGTDAEVDVDVGADTDADAAAADEMGEG